MLTWFNTIYLLLAMLVNLVEVSCYDIYLPLTTIHRNELCLMFDSLLHNLDISDLSKIQLFIIMCLT